MQFTGIGSLMSVHMTDRPIRRPADAGGDPRLRDLFFFDMIEAGFYLARRGFIAMMLPLGEAETSAFAAAVEAFLVRRRTLLSA
jgi:glutamate-1-semialdehyde 2,1-aminomutase